jgi:hypothetical protein
MVDVFGDWDGWRVTPLAFGWATSRFGADVGIDIGQRCTRTCYLRPLTTVFACLIRLAVCFGTELIESAVIVAFRAVLLGDISHFRGLVK